MITPTTTALFIAHDTEVIALPAEVVNIRDARTRAEEHLRGIDAPPHPLSVRDEVTTATVAAFRAGKPIPPLDAINAAEAETRAFAHRLEIGRDALAALDRHLAAEVADQSEAIITGSLRPVFDKLTAELCDALTLLEPFEEASRGALALANTQVRKAAGVYDNGRDTYGLLVRAAQEVRRLSPPPVHDESGEFASWRDIHTVWPRAHRTSLVGMPAPWTKAADSLAWQLRHLTAWMPTVAEQDAEWLVVYGEAAREQQVNREKRQAMAHTFGVGN